MSNMSWEYYRSIITYLYYIKHYNLTQGYAAHEIVTEIQLAKGIAKCTFAAYFFNYISARETIKFTHCIKKHAPLASSLTLPTFLTKLPPACSMILRFPAFIPRSGPSSPSDSCYIDTRVHHTPRVYTHTHIHTHIQGAIRLARGKFPAILRLHGRNNSSYPVKLLRFPRTTCDKSNQNLKIRTIYVLIKIRKHESFDEISHNNA